MKFLLLSTDNCVPCRSARNFLRNTTLNWESVYYEMNPDMFDMYGVKTTPALVKVITNEIVATGLKDIINYVNNLTYFDVSESDFSSEEE